MNNQTPGNHRLIAMLTAGLLSISPVGAQAEIEAPGVIESLLGVYVITAVATEAGGIDEDPKLNRYFDQVFDQVASTRVREGAFEWMILDTEAINALAAPGGFFAATRGLLRFVESDDELACVLGHELAHFELKHGLAKLKREMAFVIGLKVLDIILGGSETSEEEHREQAIRRAAEIVALLLKLKFSRDQEREADSMAVLHAQAAHYNPYGCLDFMERMRAREDMSALEVFVSTHPGYSERRANMHAEIRELDDGSSRTQRTQTRPDMGTLTARGPIPTLTPALTPAQHARVDQAAVAMEQFAVEVEPLNRDETLSRFRERLAQP